MQLIKNIPWKAIGILIIGLVIGLYLGAKLNFRAVERTIEVTGVAEKVNKSTQTTTTHNKVEINDLKVKNSDSIRFQFEPSTVQTPDQTNEIKPDNLLYGFEDCEEALKIYQGYLNLKATRKKRFDNWIE